MSAPPLNTSRSPCHRILTITVGWHLATRTLPNGRCVKSDALDAGSLFWLIAFYPNGRFPSTTDSASVFLELDEASGSFADIDDDIHVEVKFTLQDVGGGGAPAPPCFVSAKVDGSIDTWQKELGFARFVSREKLLGFRKHDGFSIRCDLTVLPPAKAAAAAGRSESTAVAVPPFPPEKETSSSSSLQGRAAPPNVAAARSPSTMHADLARFLETKEGADVDFELRGKDEVI